MGRSTSEFKARKDYRYFAHNSRYPDVESAVTDVPNTEPGVILHPSQSDATVTTPSKPAHQNTVREPLDLFGSLFLDIQIEILGYVAVNRPAQIFHMRRVSCLATLLSEKPPNNKAPGLQAMERYSEPRFNLPFCSLRHFIFLPA